MQTHISSVAKLWLHKAGATLTEFPIRCESAFFQPAFVCLASVNLRRFLNDK